MKLFSAVYSLLLSTALLAFNTPVLAATSDDLADIRNQLRELTERVNRLEQENLSLKRQNEALKGNEQAASSPKEQPQPGPPAGSTKAPSLSDRVAVNADFRYRYEATSDDALNALGLRTADRYRDRIRARLSAKLQATKDVAIGLGVATSEGGDPRSTNQTLGDVFSHKSVTLDLAYADWTFSDWGHLIGGKMKQPFFKPGQNLFWDVDINPEGIALTFKQGVLFGTAYSFWLSEVSGAENTRTSDPMMYGGQVGARLPLGKSNLVLAANYYDLSAVQGRAPFYSNNPSGNTTIALGAPATQVLRYGYRVIDLSAEYTMQMAAFPVQVWGDVAKNQDPSDLNTAWAVGATLGNAANPNSWSLGTEYYSVEKDAIFGQFIDADLGGGQTDVAGWVLRAAYAPVSNVTLNATYFINQHNVDVPNTIGQSDVDYRRFQLDFNTKF